MSVYQNQSFDLIWCKKWHGSVSNFVSDFKCPFIELLHVFTSIFACYLNGFTIFRNEIHPLGFTMMSSEAVFGSLGFCVAPLWMDFIFFYTVWNEDVCSFCKRVVNIIDCLNNNDIRWLSRACELMKGSSVTKAENYMFTFDQQERTFLAK